MPESRGVGRILANKATAEALRPGGPRSSDCVHGHELSSAQRSETTSQVHDTVHGACRRGPDCAPAHFRMGALFALSTFVSHLRLPSDAIRPAPRFPAWDPVATAPRSDGPLRVRLPVFWSTGKRPGPVILPRGRMCGCYRRRDAGAAAKRPSGIRSAGRRPPASARSLGAGAKERTDSRSKDRPLHCGRA